MAKTKVFFDKVTLVKVKACITERALTDKEIAKKLKLPYAVVEAHANYILSGKFENTKR